MREKVRNRETLRQIGETREREMARNIKDKVIGTDRDIVSQLRERMRERINLERQ